MTESRPPVHYLLSCSEPSLESLELARLNHIANCRKQLREIVDQWIEAEVEARLARWILDQRRERDQGVIPFPEPKLERNIIRSPGRKSPLRAAATAHGRPADV